MLNVFLTRFEGFFFLMFTLKELVTALKPVSWRGGFKKKVWPSTLPSSVNMTLHLGPAGGSPTRMSSPGRTHSSTVSMPGSLKFPKALGLPVNDSSHLLHFHHMQI